MGVNPPSGDGEPVAATRRRRRSFWHRILTSTLGKVVVVGVLGMGAVWAVPTVFAATNTVSSSKVGEGTGTVTGYTASAVRYTLNASNPSNIDSLTFTLSATPPAGSTIKVKLVSSGSDWYTCSNVAAAVSCTTTSPQASTSTANELKVVVVD